MQAQVNKNLGPGQVNANLEPGSVNTNWGPGPVNSSWGPGPVNTNWGPGPKPGAKQRAAGREIQILFKMTCICTYFAFTKNPITKSLFKIDTLNFTMYFNDFDMPFKIIRLGLHNLISIIAIKIIVFLHTCKETNTKTNKLP